MILEMIRKVDTTLGKSLYYAHVESLLFYSQNLE